MSKLPELNTEWLLSRVTLAEALAKGSYGGSYSDGILILSSVISGIAAHLWPGRDGIDRVRFVELWVRHAEPSLRPNHVSVLLLAQQLASEGDTLASVSVRSLARGVDVPPGWMDQAILTGEEIDCPEDDVIVQVPSLSRACIRRYTYGDLFYRCFRSGYVHRYSNDPIVDHCPMSSVDGNVIYTTSLDDRSCDTYVRRVYFSPSWLAAIARSIVLAAELVFDQRPLLKPPRWWANDA